MKYGKTWKGEVAELPAAWQARCIPYTAWKKAIKEDSLGVVMAWKGLLKEQCRRCDHWLVPSATPHHSWLCGRHAPVEPVPIDQRSRLCRTNALTLYKVCKRLARDLRVPSMEWYARVVGSGRYAFTGNELLATKKLTVAMRTAECPVCFEEGPREFAELPCGHAVCKQCTIKMWDMVRLHDAPLHITLKDRRCPMCRGVISGGCNMCV